LRYSKLLRELSGLAVSIAFLGSASPAGAWGDLGHKIICQIAFQELNDKARNEVIRLIALDATFDSFTDACTWPDNLRKRAEEHFINNLSPTVLLKDFVNLCVKPTTGFRRPSGGAPQAHGGHER